MSVLHTALLRSPLPHPATGEARSPVSVACVQTAAGWRTLATRWEALHARAAVASVFTSYPWLQPWWRAFGGGHRALRVLVAHRGGKAVGILPLYLERMRIAGIQARVLRLLGSGGETHPDDLGPLLAPGHEACAARALADAALAIEEADALDLEDMDPRTPFAEALHAACREAGLACERGRSQLIRYVALPQSWDAYLASLTRQRRARLRKLPQKLEAEQSARFFTWDERSSLDEALAQIARLHRKRWDATAPGASRSFATPQYIEFHREAMKACAARGWVRMYCLELGGELAAMTYCYRFRGAIYVMQAGFDPDRAQLSPGIALLGYSLRQAIEEGNTAFDFLRGEHRYKREYATGERETVYARAFRRTLGGLAYQAKRVLIPALKAHLRGPMPD